jgi:ABC-type multidrug transport system ATPase subunit
MNAARFVDVVPPPPLTGWPGPVSFELEAGKLCLFATTPGVALTLIRLMVGLREPTSGTIEVLGTAPGKLDRWAAQAFRRRLGVGFDEPSGLISNLTLRLNLVVPMVYAGLADMATAQSRAEAMIELCGLERWADTRPADMPPEVRREVVVARAAVREPELLILEEPTAGLRDLRAAWLLSMCRERATTVVVTTAERDGIQFHVADTTILIDETTAEVVHNEVGTF